MFHPLEDAWLDKFRFASVSYPQYQIDFDEKALDAVREAAVQLLTEVGLQVTYEPFLKRIHGRAGYRVSKDRSASRGTL